MEAFDALPAAVNAIQNSSLAVLAVAGVLVGAFVYMITTTRGRAIALLVAAIAAGGVYSPLEAMAVPLVGPGGDAVLAVLAAGVVMVVAWLLGRVIHGSYPPEKAKKIIYVVLLSTTFTGVLFSYVFYYGTSLVPAVSTPALMWVFSSPVAPVAWLGAALVTLFIVSKR